MIGLIAFNLVAAVLPTSQTFVPEEQETVQARPKGPLQVRLAALLRPACQWHLRCSS